VIGVCYMLCTVASVGGSLARCSNRAPSFGLYAAYMRTPTHPPIPCCCSFCRRRRRRRSSPTPFCRPRALTGQRTRAEPLARAFACTRLTRSPSRSFALCTVPVLPSSPAVRGPVYTSAGPLCTPVPAAYVRVDRIHMYNTTSFTVEV